MTNDGYSLHLIDYQFEGERWGMEIMARSPEEAEARLAAAAAWGKCIGGQAFEVPASVGWWVPWLCWLRNRFAP